MTASKCAEECSSLADEPLIKVHHAMNGVHKISNKFNSMNLGQPFLAYEDLHCAESNGAFSEDGNKGYDIDGADEKTEVMDDSARIIIEVGENDRRNGTKSNINSVENLSLILESNGHWSGRQSSSQDSLPILNQGVIQNEDIVFGKEASYCSSNSFSTGICNNLASSQSSRNSSSSNSSRKSDIINGNIVDLFLNSKNPSDFDKQTNEQQSNGSFDSHLQIENSVVAPNSQLQPTTPTGSCLKAGNKSGGSHVQFKTPYILVPSNSLLPKRDVVLEIGVQNKTESSSKVLSRLQTDSSENTPFSSLKKHKKKRIRQTSGSSTTSIGSSSTNTSESRTTEFERRAPDGGWGWVVVFASFMVHCIADGVTMSFGVLYVELLSYFDESKSLTSWVGSLFMAIPLLAGPLASVLTDKYGCRVVTIWGAIISCIGFLISAFANSIIFLFITVGIITGIGLAVCYVAAIVIVAFYFEKYRSLATGIAVAGSGIGTFIFAPAIQILLEIFGWRGCLIILAGIFLNMAVCGSLMRDLPWTKRRSDNRHSSTNTSSTSRQYSVTQSSDTLGVKGGVAASTTIPSLDELKRLVQSGEIISLLSNDETSKCITRSESLVLLPTFLNNATLPKEFLPYLSSKANAYEVVSHIYPQLLSRTLSQSELLSKELKEVKSKCILTQISLSMEDSDVATEPRDTYLKNFEVDDANEGNSLLGKALVKEPLPCVKKDTTNDKIISPRKTPKIIPRQSIRRRISSSYIGPAAPLRDMRVSRQSMTFRGAMLNIHRYRLRASSCPNIFKNSIITIAETENPGTETKGCSGIVTQGRPREISPVPKKGSGGCDINGFNRRSYWSGISAKEGARLLKWLKSSWSYLDDFGEMLTSCVNLKYCKDASYLIFALSNFILYMFYDTVYMYLTDYALGIGISSELGANLISTIGILNCVGMVLMGYLGDQSWSSPMLIYNVSMVACGLSVIAMPFITNFWILIGVCAIFGFFISANYSLTAVILVDIISLEAFSKSYGLLLLVQGIANLIGPPLVGFMADTTGNYTLPFVVSGVFIVVCGLMLYLIPIVQKCQHRCSRTSTPTSSPHSSPPRTP